MTKEDRVQIALGLKFRCYFCGKVQPITVDHDCYGIDFVCEEPCANELAKLNGVTDANEIIVK